MISEVIPGFYEFDGKRISQPKKRHHFSPRPMGSFLSQPMKIVCRDIDEIRAFLLTCRYVSDREQFGVKDHWMAPEEFEQTRRGDCDDFALWTWRQLLGLGYNARFVVGVAGRYGIGHAWVSLRVHDRILIVEPLLARYRKFPRLTTLRYKPRVSVAVNGPGVMFFEHSTRTKEPLVRIIAPLVPEWLLFRLRGWILWVPRLIRRAFLLSIRRKYA